MYNYKLQANNNKTKGARDISIIIVLSTCMYIVTVHVPQQLLYLRILYDAEKKMILYHIVGYFRGT